jgi:hypothetical protein
LLRAQGGRRHAREGWARPSPGASAGCSPSPRSRRPLRWRAAASGGPSGNHWPRCTALTLGRAKPSPHLARRALAPAQPAGAAARRPTARTAEEVLVHLQAVLLGDQHGGGFGGVLRVC